MPRTKMWATFVAWTGLVVVLLPSAIVGAPEGKESALKASEITGKVFPAQVFFRGQVAPVQMRNTGGIHFSDDAYVLAGLVDSSGYSSDIRQKYQGYLITEVALHVSGQKLPAGAYGMGFLAGDKFVAMDLGAHDVVQGSSTKDTAIKRPVPLQIVSAAGKYRLYVGRDYVELGRTQ
jgi:hypothetical protein